MNKVMCENNHFFDIDEYDVCPECGKPVKQQKSYTQQTNSKRQEIIEIFKGFKPHKKVKEDSVVVPDEPPFIQKPPYYVGDISTEGAYDRKGNDGDIETQGKYSDGVAFINDNSDETLGKYDQNKWFDYNMFNEIGTDKKSDNEVEYVQDNKSLDINIDSNVNYDKKLENGVSLSEEIKKVSANSDGHTAGYFSSMTKIKNEEKAKPKDAFNSEPTVGWLACVGGTHFGECFSLVSGRNSIGRSSNNVICINKDDRVSRDKHTFVVYEPEHREFVIQPGDGRQLTYLNGESVYSVTKIKSKDVIKIGNTKLLFVPLCDNSFSWEDYLTKE